jgi:hypothetical protein
MPCRASGRAVRVCCTPLPLMGFAVFPALGSRPNLLCLHRRFDDGRQPRHSLAHASSCRAARFPTARSPLEEFPSPTAVPTSPWDLALPRLPLRHSRLATRHPLPDDGIAPFLTSQPPTGPCSIDESVVPPTVAGERAPVPSWASGLSSHQVPGASRERDAPCPPDAPQAEPLRAASGNTFRTLRLDLGLL